jgi:DNA polymerase-3 subunit alpha
VVVTGKLSLRDDKEPQIVIDRVRPITDFAQEPEPPKADKLYLKLPTEEGKLFPKVRAILNMFPGEKAVVLYFADTQVRRGTRCQLAEPMIKELQNVLGTENVVIK